MSCKKLKRTTIAGFLMVLAACSLHAAEKNADFDKILNDPVLDGAQVGFLVRDLVTGEVLVNRNGDRVMIPASNMKIVTGAAALLALGPDYRFYTDFYLKNFDQASGEAAGIYVRGYGDPSLKEDFYETAGDAAMTLAMELKRAGLKKVSGVLWLDDSFFGDTSRPASWEEEDLKWCYAPRPGAIAVGGNCLKAEVKGARWGGSDPTVELDPPLAPELLDVDIKTVTKGSSRIRIRQDATGRVSVTGRVRAGSGVEAEYPVPYPDLLFGSALAGAMKKAGIEGSIELRRRKDLPAGYSPFRRILSPGLPEVLGVMGRESDNFIAEQVVRVLGGLKGSAGTHEEGVHVVTELMNRQHISDGHNLFCDDGSGLSRKNRLTPEMLIGLLGAFYNSYLKKEMVGIMAVPGEAGTLKKRVPQARGRLWAKTGALRGVCSLSGYYLRPNGNVAAFVMIMNGYSVHSSHIRKLQDRLVEKMLEL